MKKLLLLLLFLPIYSFAQTKASDLPIDSSGKYYISFIHNFYNRTEDVVGKVAYQFLKNSKNIIGEIEHDASSKCYIAHAKWKLKGHSKKSCIKACNVFLDIVVYYKYGRTKIRFTNFRFQDIDGDCKNGAMEEIVHSGCCDNYEIYTEKIALQSYRTSSLYKKLLKQKSRDKELF